MDIHITSELTWSLNTLQLVNKAQKRLFFLWKLKEARLPSQLPANFYIVTIECILFLGVTVWSGSCMQQDRKDLARVVRAAQGIVGTSGLSAHRPGPEEGQMYCTGSHPSGLFQLPSGKQYRNIKVRTTRLKDSFFPKAVKSISPLHTHTHAL